MGRFFQNDVSSMTGLSYPTRDQARQCPEWRTWLTTLIILSGPMAHGQEALRNSLAGEAAADARRLRPETLPYTFKSGDFRLWATPSLRLDYNDNVYTADSDEEDDFILRPLLQVNLSYPITQYNLLILDVGVGYDKYFDHDDLSAWRLQSGSQLSFDIYVTDFWINLHERFQFVQDSAQESSVAGTGSYGTFNNTVGLSVTWDLDAITLSSGYDHVNVFSPENDFRSQDRASEMVFGRAGFELHPRVLAGLEGTTSWTRYEHPLLNDNAAYSLGVYADWRPSSYFQLQPRGGYAIYQFEQTSQSIQTEDQNFWYAGLTITHQPSESFSYSLSAGHEIRLGVQSDLVEITYVRLNGNWSVMKDVRLSPFLTYEHGDQGSGNIAGNLQETYDWFGGGIGLSYSLTERLSAGLNYRLTLRASDVASREYAQNLVGLQLTYQLK